MPENAQYFAALGAIEHGIEEDESPGRYTGRRELERRIADRRAAGHRGILSGLCASRQELEDFRERYRKKPFQPRPFRPGETVRAFIGLDGGSTSTKAVLLSPEKEVLVKAYRLSSGNPVDDTKEIFGELRGQVESAGARLDVLGVAVTGYAKDVLENVLGADVAIVETVAHAASALHFYDDVDVICDVGGQDIKIMLLKDGNVKDFKLNTQCSAGNGYFLQSTAQDFGIPVERYAEVAFEAQAMPNFSYGCAVFLQSDIVNFQRQGWKPAEILAGLAVVLPKNIWLYVAQIPNLSKLGTKFVLQGGTQHNLAAVKAQVDFIRSRIRGRSEEPEIIVHEHCGESGAIGAALEAVRRWEDGRETTFIGLDAVSRITYEATTNEETRCRFCKNLCLRTFIDVESALRPANGNGPGPGVRRLIVGNSCEKGSVVDPNDMRLIKAELDEKLRRTENFAQISARGAFQSFSPKDISDPPLRFAFTVGARRRGRARERRRSLRIGIPRVLGIYSAAPLLGAYFESLGVPFRNIVFSDYTSEKLYRDGGKRSAIDPCFPSKLGIPHVHNLIYVKHAKKPLDVILFPMLDDLPSDLDTRGCRVCPTITATPAAVRAAFTQEGNVFRKKRIRFLSPFLNVAQPKLFERQMYQQLGGLLGLSRGENARAIRSGYAALAEFDLRRRRQGKRVLTRLEGENGIGIVLLGRPYHHDPGINHDILVEFQKRGYPLFTADSLPLDPEILERLFGDEVRAGIISHPLDISDVWKNSLNGVSNQKLWAAKYAATTPEPGCTRALQLPVRP